MKKGSGKVNAKESLKAIGKFLRQKKVVIGHGKTKEHKEAMKALGKMEKLVQKKVKVSEMLPCSYWPIDDSPIR